MGRWKRFLALLLAAAAALCCAGCSDRETGGESYAPAEDRRLVIYTSHKQEVWWPIVKEFEERTGIWVDVVTGGTNELLERIAREADGPRADVMFGGGVESLESFRQYLAPCVCAGADSLLPQYCEPDGLWTPFSALPVVLIYNTKLMEPGRLTCWRDLLEEDLRGRIAFADPAISGSCFTGLVTLLEAVGGDADAALRRFAENIDGRQLDSSGAILDAVADGSAWVGVTLEETALKRVAAGEDIALVYPADGTSSVPDATAAVLGAPHLENARLFLNFTVSPEVQGLLADSLYRRSVRGDVETDLIPLDEIAMVEYDVARASRERVALLMSWAFYLGGEDEA